jgi:nucleoside-diphosphate-sugar epimerase
MRILIIGGTAFMGPWVAQELAAAGHQVTVFHRGQTEGILPVQVEHIHCEGLSFDDRHELAAFRETFQHLAPDVVVDMMLMTEAAARTTLQVFHGIARRLVVASSQDAYAAYGRMLGQETGPVETRPAAEDSPLRANLYPYRSDPPRAASDPRHWMDTYDKILVERVAISDPELPGTILRLPMVYGPGDKQHRLYDIVRRIEDGRPFLLLDEALANWRGARGYVEDMGHAIALAAVDERAVGQIYNVVEPEIQTELEWEQEIGHVMGWHGKILLLPGSQLPEALRADFDARYSLLTDASKIRAELGYTETLPREEALRRTIAWERAHPPQNMDPARFDYAAEDEALKRA